PRLAAAWPPSALPARPRSRPAPRRHARHGCACPPARSRFRSARSRPEAWTVPGSVRDRRGSSASLPFRVRSVLLFGADHAGQSDDRQRVAVDAEAGEHGLGRLRHIGVVPEGFALVNVGDVAFDHRDADGEDGVHDGDRGGGVAGRVDDDAGGALRAGLLDVGDHFAFAVGLAEDDVDAEAPGGGAAERLDVGERRRAVFLRLARAEQVHVRPVEDVDGRGHGVTGGAPDGARRMKTLVSYRWTGGRGEARRGAQAAEARVSAAAQSMTSLTAVNLWPPASRAAR